MGLSWWRSHKWLSKARRLPQPAALGRRAGLKLSRAGRLSEGNRERARESLAGSHLRRIGVNAQKVGRQSGAKFASRAAQMSAHAHRHARQQRRRHTEQTVAAARRQRELRRPSFASSPVCCVFSSTCKRERPNSPRAERVKL